ncbi:MAG: hypothetical protein LUF35_11940 [Lachnospiraceae bacterium]|nr:hypothetical protein [Lachnospiraceae bacterium]
MLPVSEAASEYEYVYDDIYGYSEDTGIYAQEEAETESHTDDEPEESENTSEFSGQTVKTIAGQNTERKERKMKGVTEKNLTFQFSFMKQPWRNE